MNGSRWNSVGVRVAYASESVALATLEVLVGLQESRTLDAYSIVSARIDETKVETLPRDTLPANWRTYPPPPETQVIGNQWVLDGRSVVLRVPSAIVDTESNFLLNPAHPEFRAITISTPTPYAFDSRLLSTRAKS